MRLVPYVSCHMLLHVVGLFQGKLSIFRRAKGEEKRKGEGPKGEERCERIQAEVGGN